MSTSIVQFLIKATGPKNMCTQLRLKTRSLRMLLRDIDSVNSIQTEIPQDVFGGDIFTLMSGRLKELLQYQEQTKEADSVVSKGNPRFFTTNDIPSASKTAFMNTILKKKKESSFPQLKDSSQKDKKAFQKSVPFENVPKLNLIDFLKFAKALQIREVRTLSQYRNAPSIIEKDIIINKEGKRDSKAVTSIFISKLRDYWQLSLKDQNSKKDKGRLIDEDIEREKDTIPFALPPAGTLSQRSWPERIGKQAAQKIHSLSFGEKMKGHSRHIQQTSQSHLPEKLDIHNIFNIDVKAEGDRGMDFTRDLSEKIADILRHQALQHGIDIT